MTDWVAIAISFMGFIFTISTFLLSSILRVLNGIRTDLKNLAEKQHITDIRVTVIEEIVKKLKCQRCENG